MLNLPEIMKTEVFWAPMLGVSALLFMALLIVLDRWRRPEIYTKKQNQTKKT